MLTSYKERFTVYDTEHGNQPEFISGNYYNYHELKYQRAKRPKNGKVRTYTIADMERAAAEKQRAIDTKDARRAARQATRLAAQQSRAADSALHLRELAKPCKKADPATAAREVLQYSLELGSNPYNLPSIHV